MDGLDRDILRFRQMGLTIAEIAVRVGLHKATVSRRLRRLGGC